MRCSSRKSPRPETGIAPNSAMSTDPPSIPPRPPPPPPPCAAPASGTCALDASVLRPRASTPSRAVSDSRELACRSCCSESSSPGVPDGCLNATGCASERVKMPRCTRSSSTTSGMSNTPPCWWFPTNRIGLGLPLASVSDGTALSPGRRTPDDVVEKNLGEVSLRIGRSVSSDTCACRSGEARSDVATEA